MTYSAVYCALIERRRQHALQDSVYGEVHHVIPKSEGGDDSKENLVRLSAREHYIAHLLLAKIYDDVKMYSALTYMQTHRHKNRIFKFNSHLYEKLREEFGRKISTSYKGRHYYNNGKIEVKRFECPEGFVPGRMQYSEKALQNMKLGSQSEKHKAASRANFQKAAAMNKGKPFSEEHRHKISEAVKGEKNGMYRKTLSKEARDKISKAHKGKPKSKETKAKMKANNANKSPVLQFTKDGKFIAEYATMSEAELATGIQHGQIRRVILGISSYGDFIWKYKESSEN